MRSVVEIHGAFASARRPTPEEIPDIVSSDPERNAIRDLLAPHAPRDVPDSALGRYPLYTMFPFLSAAAFRYYMPRFIDYCVANPQSMLSESLLFALARDDYQRAATFVPIEKAVIREYLELITKSPDAWPDADEVKKAGEVWA